MSVAIINQLPRLKPSREYIESLQDDVLDSIVHHASQHLRNKRNQHMHYRNGREAKNGDKVVQLSYDTGRVAGVGVLYGAVPGNDYCNGGIAVVHGPTSACLCDCIHVDDLAELLKEKGLDKRPSGK